MKRGRSSLRKYLRKLVADKKALKSEIASRIPERERFESIA